MIQSLKNLLTNLAVIMCAGLILASPLLLAGLEGCAPRSASRKASKVQRADLYFFEDGRGTTFKPLTSQCCCDVPCRCEPVCRCACTKATKVLVGFKLTDEMCAVGNAKELSDCFGTLHDMIDNANYRLDKVFEGKIYAGDKVAFDIAAMLKDCKHKREDFLPDDKFAVGYQLTPLAVRYFQRHPDATLKDCIAGAGSDYSKVFEKKIYQGQTVEAK